MSNKHTKVIKFHGTKVKNVILHYSESQRANPDKRVIEEFDALLSEDQSETINVQVVADYVTITFYKRESSNSIIRRELIPTHIVQHIWIHDLEYT
jgi:hypothetical protein